MSETGYRICSICEAACGLKISLDGRQVIGIEANDDDVFSEGHICAKGIALAELDADPDRLRKPLVRRDGRLTEVSWDEAYDFICERLNQIKDAHGVRALATYVGNPTAHNIGLSLGLGVYAASSGSPSFYTAGTVDQVPKQLACELMFGNDLAIPVPDIERADYFLMLGANPVVSNGSLWVVPKVRERIRAFRARGGKLVTVDPRRTETARAADEHVFIRPGTDAWLLAALINQLVDLGCKLPDDYPVQGFEDLRSALSDIDLTTVAERTGISEADIRQIATDLKDTAHPVVYGRVGTTLQAFGTLTSFLVEVLNLMTGSLDSEGGAMFPEQTYHAPSSPSGGLKHNRFQTRVSGLPEVLGQLPVAALAEEIETPGDGQIRALVCFAGNPVVSNPESDRLARALASLDLLVCVDIYHNETTRLADVVLPGTSPFEDSHYDSFLGAMGYRNAARYSAPLFDAEQPREWDIGLKLGFVAANGRVPDDAELRTFEDNVVARTIGEHVEDKNSGIYGRDPQEIMGLIEPEAGAERLLDLGIRAGRWGDHFGAREGLTLQQLVDTPNGIDLGAVRSGRLTEVVGHADGRLDLAPEMVLTEIERLRTAETGASTQLIGRRLTRANNSWLRNLPMLGKGRSMCTLFVNSDDARQIGINDGEDVEVSSNVGVVTATAEVTDDVVRGVVCLPHGFSEDEIEQRNGLSGPNYNRLASAGYSDGPSSTVALNGVAVTIRRK